MVTGETITVEFSNDNIDNEHWAGIAFGETMHDLEIVVAKIHENRTSLATGFTYGYGWVALDPMPVVQELLLSYKSKRLRFVFSRPLGKHGPREHSLEGCQTWNFMKEGDIVAGHVFQHSKPLPVKVCPKKCKSKILRLSTDN
ncbi:DOMON domain protein [Ostertagia ostertagi]